MSDQSSALIRRPLNQICAQKGIPVSGIFELTPRCNLQCKMCYVRLTPQQMAQVGRELTTDEWLSLAREAASSGMLFLLLTGGEPTLRNDFPQLYEGFTRLGLSISVNTNGTNLTPEIRNLWHRLPPAQVNVTLYGTCREDYEALCGSPDAYDRVMDGLNWLRQEGILFHLNTTITRENAGKWLALEEIAQQMHTDLRMTVYCFPPQRRGGCECVPDFSRLSPEEAGQMIVKDLVYRNGTSAALERLAYISQNVPPPANKRVSVTERPRCNNDLPGRTFPVLDQLGRNHGSLRYAPCAFGSSLRRRLHKCMGTVATCS